MPPTTPPAEAPAAAQDAEAERFAPLESKLGYLSAADVQLVRQAHRFAEQAHAGQTRHSGEPYITHPIAVAAQVAEWKLDAPALMAALLHDAMEDCGVTRADLTGRFGSAVADMVDGLTKLDKLQFSTREEGQAESFRKMLLAMARDVRVILVKLADRLHNMRTMGDMPRSKWGRISTETLEIYAPIAHRLGLHQAYRELRDLCLRYLKPWRYQVLAKAVHKARQRRRELTQKVQQQVQHALEQAGLKARIVGREKDLYSIYRRMDEGHLSFAQVSDLYGIRVILPSVMDCYTALGALHQLYKPVPGRFNDYIAIPKINGYQSLHTTLSGPASVNIEFQIRTDAMDLVAEAGVAAHWLHKADHDGSARARAGQELGTRWLQSLLDIQSQTRDAAEFWDNIKVDLTPDAVYVFTPKGQIMALPQGATVVDFAYAIHSNIGDHAISAKINGEQMPLRTELANGDVVEILTAATAAPNPAWLGFVRTGRARSHIRSHLKSLTQEKTRELGEQLLAQALRAEGLGQPPAQDAASQPIWEQLLRFAGNRSRDEMLTDIGLGRHSASVIAKHLATLMASAGVRPDALLLTQARYTAHESLSQGAVTLDGAENVAIQYAPCCHPIPGDGVLGYLGRGEGLVVHTDQCAVARRLQSRDAERFITVAWAEEPVRPFNVGIIIAVVNQPGVLARVATALAAAGSNIVHFSMGEEGEQEAQELHFLITVRNRSHLDEVLRHLRRTHAVLRVVRSTAAD